MKTFKRLIAFTIAFIFTVLSTSCTLLIGGDGEKIDRSYPSDIVPIYDDAVTYDYENVDDERFKIYAGTKDSLSDVAEFYSDYFEKEDMALNKESRNSDGYKVEGISDGWQFEIYVEKPKSNSDKMLYNTVIEIFVEFQTVAAVINSQFVPIDISANTSAKDNLNAIEDDLRIIRELIEDSGSDEDMSLDELLQMFDDYQQQIDNRIDVIKTRTLNESQLVYLQNSEIALFQILLDMLDELELMCYYAIDLLEISINMDENMAGVDSTDEYGIYYAIETALTQAGEELSAVNAPSFLQYKHSKLIEKLDEYLTIATDTIWAYNSEDNLRMSNYNYFIDYYLLYFTDFLVDIDADLSTRMIKFEDDINYIKTWMDELDYFVGNTLNTSTLDLALYNQEYLLVTEDINISCSYTAHDEVVPANYRSMEYLVFLEIWTNRDTADVMVTVEIPDYTQQYKERITVNRAETELAILPPLVADIAEKLNSSKNSQIEITVEDINTGEIILQESKPILLNSIYDMRWGDEGSRLYYENILSWVTPENDMVLQLQRNAADSVEIISGGKIDGIWGYQGDGGSMTRAEITYYQTAAIMHAMADAMDVKYINASFSTTDKYIQRIATPDRVLNNASGLCIETSVTLASALMAARMNAMILVLPRHAQVAVETWYDSGEYLLIETTALQSAKNQNFEYVISYLSKEEWQQYIAENHVVAIDCSMASKLGIYPID